MHLMRKCLFNPVILPVMVCMDAPKCAVTACVLGNLIKPGKGRCVKLDSLQSNLRLCFLECHEDALADRKEIEEFLG